jgi:23S rRNA (guanosine2251-2'-O)-methyltransferase
MAITIFGIHSVREELLSAASRPCQLFLAAGQLSPRLQELVDLAEQRNVSVKTLDRPEFEALIGRNRHQGVALQLEPFTFLSLDGLLKKTTAGSAPKAFFLILDSISDPRNFGAILRNADAAGCQGVIIAKDRSCPVTGVVHKASAGALAHVPVCRVTNLSRAIEELKEAGIWVYGLGADEAGWLFDEELRGDLALVVGCEGKGLRPNVRKHCDAMLAIPMSGGVSSLNVSVAAAIALFEVVRQRRRMS